MDKVINNIEVRGAKSNNLKNLDVDLPLNQFIARYFIVDENLYLFVLNNFIHLK